MGSLSILALLYHALISPLGGCKVAGAAAQWEDVLSRVLSSARNDLISIVFSEVEFFLQNSQFHSMLNHWDNTA